MISKLAIPAVIGVLIGATELPSTSEASSIGWVMIILVSIIVGLDRALSFYKTHIKEQPSPAGTYATITSVKEGMAEIRDMVRSTNDKLEEWSRDHYSARRRMHKKLNAQTNALHYMAGLMARDGNKHDAEHIRSLIQEAPDGED